jgi:predicted phosphodiesterase
MRYHAEQDPEINLYMRIAIISDIHSNLQALTKALTTIKSLGVDEIYCLGDIVGYGANPNECVELVRKHAKLTVLGNHDHASLYTTYTEYLPRDGKKAALWTHKILDDENRRFLANLKYRAETDLCTLVHASPDRPEYWYYIDSAGDAEKQFSFFSTRICLTGHTHVPFLCRDDLQGFTLTPEGRFLINPGSVGQPRDGKKQLSFGLLDTDAWEYRNYRLDYDIDGAAQAIRKARLPRSLARRLYHGY